MRCEAQSSTIPVVIYFTKVREICPNFSLAGTPVGSKRFQNFRNKEFLLTQKIRLHSGLTCINFVFEIMIPKKGSKSKIFIKQTIYRWFQVPAPNLSYFGPFLTFSLIFLNFSFMISWNSISQKPMKPVFACKV